MKPTAGDILDVLDLGEQDLIDVLDRILSPVPTGHADWAADYVWMMPGWIEREMFDEHARNFPMATVYLTWEGQLDEPLIFVSRLETEDGDFEDSDLTYLDARVLTRMQRLVVAHNAERARRSRR